MALFLRKLPEPVQVRVLTPGPPEPTALASEVVEKMGGSSLLLVLGDGGASAAGLVDALRHHGQARRVVELPVSGSCGPDGWTREGARLLGTPRGVRVAARCVPSIGRTTFERAASMLDALARDLGRTTAELDPDHHVVALFADARCGSAELLSAALASARFQLPLVGASLDRGPPVLDGRSEPGGAAVILFESEARVSTFHAHPYRLTPVRVVVTGCDASGHRVTELDGHPAVSRLCDLGGFDRSDLGGTPAGVLARLPVQLAWVLCGETVIRPVLGAEDETIELGGPVERGVVLRLARRDANVPGALHEGLLDAIEAAGASAAEVWAFACANFLEGPEGEAFADAIRRTGVLACAVAGQFHGPALTRAAVTGIVWGRDGR